MSRIASVTCPLCEQGLVSLPHGWGHGVDGARLHVANDHPGVNSIC